MTTADRIELDRALTRALGAVPTDRAMTTMETRVAVAIAAPEARRMPRPSLPRLRRSRGMALIAVVTLVTVAAGGATLIDRVFRNSTPAWELAWSRAKPLGLSETVHGVTVGVERAYMDQGRVVIGLTMEGYAYAQAELRVDGRRARGGAVYQVPHKGGSAAVLNFSTPPDVGARAKLVLDIPCLSAPGAPTDTTPVPGPSMRSGTSAARPATGPCRTTGPGTNPTMVDGPWRFEFSLPNAGGSTWTGSVADMASDVTVTLDRLEVTPTSVVAYLHWSGDPLRRSGDDVWTAMGRLTHDGERFGAGSASTNGNHGQMEAEPGSDDPAGEWTLRIDELTSDPGYPPKRIRIEGPWVIKVTMPR